MVFRILSQPILAIVYGLSAPRRPRGSRPDGLPTIALVPWKHVDVECLQRELGELPEYSESADFLLFFEEFSYRGYWPNRWNCLSAR